MKAQDKQSNTEVQLLASQLTLHVAAMKPVYLSSADVPQEVKVKAQEDETTKGGKKRALDKLFRQEVMLEQELATSEDAIKIKELIKQKEALLNTTIQVKEYALFNIGA